MMFGAGMRHLHSLGMIHRDMKSDNCLVDDGLHVKVHVCTSGCLVNNFVSE